METKPTFAGIYAIRHVVSGRRYIGNSKNIYLRWLNHRTKLRKNIHDSKHLQNAWNKYSENAFVFEVIEATLDEPTILVAREQYWIDKYKKKLLNCRAIAEQFNQDWYRTDESKETRDKASKRMKAYRDGLQRNLICEQCKEPFITNAPSGKVKFCSTKCRNQWRWITGKYKETRTCVVCNREFQALIHQSTKACSKLCAPLQNLPIDFRHILDIATRVLAGEGIKEIAGSYGVSRKVIRHIAGRDSFKNVELPPKIEDALKARKAQNMKQYESWFSEEDIRKIKIRLATGEQLKTIAKDFDTDFKRISPILRNTVFGYVVMSEEIEAALERRRNSTNHKKQPDDHPSLFPDHPSD